MVARIKNRAYEINFNILDLFFFNRVLTRHDDAPAVNSDALSPPWPARDLQSRKAIHAYDELLN